jgi:hypothetical protein
MGEEIKRLLDGIKNGGRSEVLGSTDPTVVFNPPTTFPNPVTLVNLAGSDGEGEMVTVYLDATEENGPDTQQIVIPPDPSVVAYRPYLVAMIEWGMDGYQAQAEVDFVRGSAFSLTASYLRVKAAVDKAAFALALPTPFKSVRCAALCSYGSRPSTHQGPTRTMFTNAIDAAGDSIPMQIPRFARSASLMLSATTFPVPNHRLSILDSNNAPVSQGFMAGINPGQDAQDVMLPIDARLFQVHNAGAAPAVFRVVFHLAF